MERLRGQGGSNPQSSVAERRARPWLRSLERCRGLFAPSVQLSTDQHMPVSDMCKARRRVMDWREQYWPFAERGGVFVLPIDKAGEFNEV